MSNISTWSPIAANNTAAPPDGYPELMPASAVNNTDRETQAAVRRQAERGGWFDWGLTPTYISAASFSVPGDQTAVYQVGRRVQGYGPGWQAIGTVTSASYTSSTAVVLAMDSDPLQSDLTAVEVGVEAGITTPVVTFPAGTEMLFHQAAAPAGWSFVATASGHTLQTTATEAQGGTTSGAGDDAEWTITGLSVGTAITNGLAVDGHALTLTEIPSHNHNIRLHGRSLATPGIRYDPFSDSGDGSIELDSNAAASPSPNGTEGPTANNGSGGTHTHGLSGTVTLTDGAVASTGAWRAPARYVIVCSKDA